jgi:hypothetical protein
MFVCLAVVADHCVLYCVAEEAMGVLPASLMISTAVAGVPVADTAINVDLFFF